ncbi:stability determinant [Castellaniella sp.]|uniref:type II toxin-antitoxin system RelB family antitoxin n=1 Tax=Castellaniella sp. TaxID=1955812 RepID=UPI002B001B61|nr:stability determinant [Castellaniella sp.]
MSVALSPIVSEFETEEQAASYDRWFRAKVQASRDDPRPSIPHDEAMARIRQKLTAKVAKQEKADSSRSRDV